ncbi:hypothetical protein BTE77_34910 [Ensifer adhaerens]|nr:hypothetical protein BTE77_34910 [Ensifer adhaerens]
MVPPISPEPLKVGRASSVVPLSTTVPVVVPMSSTTLAIVGFIGLVVSTVKSHPVEATLVLPAASVALTVIVWTPSLSGWLASTVKAQLPFAEALVVPSRIAPS